MQRRLRVFQKRGLKRGLGLGVGLLLAGAIALGVILLSPSPGTAAKGPQPLPALDATIQARGKLVVAVKENLRPLGFRDAQGQLVGFEIDLAQRLAQELLGTPKAVVEFKPVTNQDRLGTVLRGEADLAIARVTATAARSRLVTFSLPYYWDGTALITQTPGLTPADLSDRAIAALAGSNTVEQVRSRFPQAKLVLVKSYEAAKNLMEQQQVAAFAADGSILSGWVQESTTYHLLLPTLSVEPLCIVMPKGLQHDPLRQRINQILLRWQAEQWLQQRAAFWQLPD